MSNNWCKKCDGYLFNGKECICKPFEFNHEGWGEEWREIHVRGTHEQAAEKVAEHDWGEDPCDPSNFELVVSVRDAAGTTKQFIVGAEARVDFNARELV